MYLYININYDLLYKHKCFFVPCMHDIIFILNDLYAIILQYNTIVAYIVNHNNY